MYLGETAINLEINQSHALQTHTKLAIVLTIIVISFFSFAELFRNVVSVLGVGILEKVVEKKETTKLGPIS